MLLSKIKKFFNQYKCYQDGVAAIEFALLAIPFLLSIFGIMEAGRIMYTANGVQYALEEVSRQVSLNETLTAEEITRLAKEKLADLQIDQSSWDITSATINIAGADFLEVSAQYQMPTLITLLTTEESGIFNIESTIRTPLTD